MLKNIKSDTISIHRVSNNTGYALSVVPSAFIIENKYELQQRKTQILKLLHNPDGSYGGVATSWEDIESLRQSGKATPQFLIPNNWQEIPLATNTEIDPLELKLSAYRELSSEQRAQAILEIRKSISELNKAKAPPEEKAQKIIDSLLELISINKVTLTLAHKYNQLHSSDKDIAADTLHIEKNILEMVENSAVVKSLFGYFKKLSNGQTLNHCIRVTILMASFLHFYNKVLQESIAVKINLTFSAYLPYYKKLFPTLAEYKLNYYALMRLGNIESQRMLLWLHGANFHDIGKMANLDYFESNAISNPAIIRNHVFDGQAIFSLVYNAQFAEATAMVGDHHYRLRKGYSVTPIKIKNPEICITENYTEYTQGKALGFLPIEILSIIDIYDALIDSSRIYKLALPPAEALAVMHDHNVLTGRMDPIIFDLFVDFLQGQGIAVPENLGFSVKYARRPK